MPQQLLVNLEQTFSIILFGIGFTLLLLHRNLMKKIIGLNIMDTSVYLFLTSLGYISGREVPIVLDLDKAPTVEQFINPIPTGLVLTGIVVSVSFTAIMLGLVIRLYRRYRTLDIDEITLLARQEVK